MSLPVPLSVRLKTSARDIHITDQIDDLTFGATSPGGYAQCTTALHRPLAFTPAEVRQYARLYVYDSRTGDTVWEGRVQDPGRAAGDRGEVYQLAAVGGSAHLSETTLPLIYVDRRLDGWLKRDDTASEIRTATVERGEEIGGTQRDTLYLTIPSGTKLTVNKSVTAVYWALADAGQECAVVNYTWDSGISSPNSFIIEFLMGNGVVYRSDMPSTSGGGPSTRSMGANWPAGQTTPLFRLRWNTATAFTVNDDFFWAAFVAPVVVGVRYLADGTKKVSGYGSADETILASTVVADLLGRVMTDTIDGAGALIFPSPHQIDQLAYPDGVTPAQVLADLLEFEPAYTWHVWESNSTGKFTFEWTPWPTAVRYEADALDGLDAPASGATVYNAVRVRYRDARGRNRSVLRTSLVPDLADAGFSRTAFLDLGEEKSSEANAIRAGDQFLSEHRYAVNAGRLVVRRPVRDLVTGRMVQPWEIRPGQLIRVRGIQPYPDSLNASTRDGVTTFQIAATSYSASRAEATLDLDSYAPSVARALAALARRKPGRRR
ncbi:hypothetical protein ACGFIG_09285 [Micromonospora sp. NPDC049048]|uniref:hypothetical protein n=1 Tax=Micromonospora sp. NPDC049048 TaxID=3364263 RepID=UPI00371FEC78